MPRRRKLLIATTTLVCLAVLACFFLARQVPTSADADRIQPGMTYDEVIAVLGRPHDDLQSAAGWIAWDGQINVSFDERRRVLGCSAHPMKPLRCLLRRLDRALGS